MTNRHTVVASHAQPEVKASRGRFPLDFFALVFGLSAPLWLIGGNSKLPLPVNLPTSALMTFVPALAASILSFRESGMRGVKDLWKRVFDFRRIKNKAWFLPIFFLMPVTHVLSYVVMRVTGMSLPDQVDIPLSSVPALAVMFFIGDTAEELGWMGYATDPMQEKWGPIKASLIFGGVYVLWHVIPFVQTGNPPSWFVWQSLNSVTLRVLHAWVYNNTGKSVFATILFHDSVNMSWTLFPNYGSHYNPFVTGIINLIATLVIISVWGGRMLARSRSAESSISG